MIIKAMKDDGGGYSIHSLEELRQIADSFNCDLYEGGPSLLLLDIDTPAQGVQFDQLFPLLLEKFPLAKMTLTWQSRGDGRHIVIDLGVGLSVPERLALQSALGSDPRRTLLAVNEWDRTRCDTISLFRPRGTK